MYLTVSALPDAVRARLAGVYNGVLADSLALYVAAKTAHWNVKGSGAHALHLLFDKLAAAALERVDDLAERVTALGALTEATVPIVASTSPLAAYPVGVVAGAEHVKRLLAHYGTYDARLRAAREAADKAGDRETVQYLDAALFDVEREAGFLAAEADMTAPTPPAPVP